MAQITFEDKVALREVNLPRKNTITAEDINEIKESVNALYSGGGAGSVSFWTIDLMDSNTGTIYAPFDLKITSIENVFDDTLLTITVNDFPYTIGDNIVLGSKIIFSIPSQGVNNVNFELI